MIITIANLKGGVGRTTTAMLLACAFARLGRQVTVLDTDHYGAAAWWANYAQDDGDPLPFSVTRYPLSDDAGVEYPDKVSMITEMVSPEVVTIIDTCSHAPDIVRAVSEISDFVIVPCSASVVDYSPTMRTLDSLSAPHAVLMTQIDERTRAAHELRRRLVAADVFVFAARIPHREVFKQLYGATPGKQLHGYEEVVQELLRDSAGERRHQVAWEKQVGASLFTGLRDRIHDPAYMLPTYLM